MKMGEMHVPGTRWTNRTKVKGVTLGKNAPSIRSNKFNISVAPIADMFSFSYGAIN
jgi:hypothetical protein